MYKFTQDSKMNEGQFWSHNAIVCQIELVNLTALCFLLQYGNVIVALADDDAGSVTAEKAIQVSSSKH